MADRTSVHVYTLLTSANYTIHDTLKELGGGMGQHKHDNIIIDILLCHIHILSYSIIYMP